MKKASRQSTSTKSTLVDESSLRACSYLRVSTGRQSENDLSIPDQRNQIVAFCANRGLALTTEFIEPGASGMDDSRREFQKMIAQATDSDRPFDVVIVHSYSRFFRDAFGLEMYVRRLAKAGVRLISITQELGDDPSQIMMRQVIALFDEYQSRENGKHVKRAMVENARQGFHNGSPVAFGYVAKEVERRGNRVKKKLFVDPVEAETVKLIFKLYQFGENQSGPMGIKAIVTFLNQKGYRTRQGAYFGIRTIHCILTNTTYIGESIFNRRDSKTHQLRDRSEWVVVNVPPIINRAQFEEVQATLKSRDPQVTPPRVTTGPILLTGLAFCSSCSGAMTLRTGTSRSGSLYRYYACSTCAHMGKVACKGRSIRMDKLDTLVTDSLAEKLLSTDRLADILTSIAAQRAVKSSEVDSRLLGLRTEVLEAETKLKRLYQMVEDGCTDLDDILKERIYTLKQARDRAQAALERIGTNNLLTELPLQTIEAFGQMMRDNLSSGDVPFRKAYLRSVVSRIEVDDNIVRIIGNKSAIEQAMTGQKSDPTGVRSFVLKWRPHRDSNPGYRLEKPAS